MWKEITICIAIIVIVIVGNYITQKYTDEAVQEINSRLDDLKEEMLRNEPDEVNIKNSVNEIEKSWDLKCNKLAFYLEHDELEKVEAHITSLKSFIETKEYPEAICELDNSIFVLKHIEEKYAYSLENLF